MIHQLPPIERPRERLLSQGAEALSLAELLAVVLGTGVRGKSIFTLSAELIESFGSAQGLMQASVEELTQIEGIGLAKALQLKAAFAFSLRAMAFEKKEKRAITSPDEAYHYLRPHLFGKRCEELFVILRDAKGCVIAIDQVSRGTLTQITTHPRELFIKAIARSAYSLIVAHNHPSGDTTPSEQDHHFTQRVSAAGRILNIPLDDHLIVSDNTYFSFYSDSFFEKRAVY